MPSERALLGGFVAGNAAMRELSHPTRKKCAMKAFLNILFRSMRFEETPRHWIYSVDRDHRGQPCCLYQRKRNRFYDRQILDTMRLNGTAYAGTDPHEIDRRAYTHTAGNMHVRYS